MLLNGKTICTCNLKTVFCILLTSTPGRAADVRMDRARARGSRRRYARVRSAKSTSQRNSATLERVCATSYLARLMAAAAAPVPNGGEAMPVKVQLGDEKARLSVRAVELTLDGLSKAVRQCFAVPRGQICRLRFIDDEGDPCKLTTPEDLREAVRLRVPPAPLKLVLGLQSADEERNAHPGHHAKREAREDPDAAGACGGSPRKRTRPRAARAALDSVVAAVFMKRDERRHKGRQRSSPWRPCKPPFHRVLIRVVAHKTKPFSPSMLVLGSDGMEAEPDQFESTTTIDTVGKVAHHINCDVADLIHLNQERYGQLKPQTGLRRGTLLLQPFRPRTIEGLVVAHDASQDQAAVRFRIAALDRRRQHARRRPMYGRRHGPRKHLL